MIDGWCTDRSLIELKDDGQMYKLMNEWIGRWQEDPPFISVVDGWMDGWW